MYLPPRSNDDKHIDRLPINGKAAIVLTISLVETFIATCGILLRIYAARTGASRLRWDFWFVIGATALGIPTEALFVMGCQYGVGKHIHTVQFNQLWLALKYSWIGIYTGLMGTLVGKSAIVAILYQVATPTQWKRKALLLAIGGFNVTVGTIQLVLSITQCTPYNKLWYQLIPGNCNRTKIAFTFGYFQGSVAIATDFLLALYPITIVWNLQASMRTKVGFCVLMAGGVICAVAAIMRTHYTTILRTPKDPTYDLVTFLGWASTELWLVTIIASIPPLRPLFLRWIGATKTIIASSKGSRSKSTQDGSIPLGSLKSSRASKTPRLTTNDNESKENILRPKNDSDKIVVTKSYNIEVNK
ncbi:hypothetical protein K461DRAFT_310834 [Myriangium duriaei CBS 260.36]|uniref:Rhodopsin domain-containing protein n=1 Tax=Myriangium duriaei CBS 260.36 TaxID=1168546 RepID=A0A9P4JAD3_9PEZI|nr:hypothetical protein K461DRAFT_310834 [Myriangium duriaei CBS 260.36]